MPLRTAARKCPDAVFLPVDKPAYDAASAVRDGRRCGRFDVPVEVLGWDEAFIGRRAPTTRRRSPTTCGRPCSRRAGCTARSASATTSCRPRSPRTSASRDGVGRLTADNWFEVMGERPDRRRCGGSAARPPTKLADLGIDTVTSWPPTEAQVLADRLGPTMGPWYRRLGPRRGLLAGRRHAVGRARARPRDHVPAEPVRLGGGRGRGPRARRPGDRGHRGRGPARRAGGHEAALRAVRDPVTLSLTLPAPTSDVARHHRRGARAADPLRPDPRGAAGRGPGRDGGT